MNWRASSVTLSSCHPEPGRPHSPNRGEGSAFLAVLPRAFLVLAVAVFLGVALHAANGATLTYRRVFKNSSPEFIEIKVSEDGPATDDIRQSSEDPDPQSFELGAPVRAKLFALAGELHNFEQGCRTSGSLGDGRFKPNWVPKPPNMEEQVAVQAAV